MATPQEVRNVKPRVPLDKDIEKDIYEIALETGVSVTRLANGILRHVLNEKSDEEILACLKRPTD